MRRVNEIHKLVNKCSQGIWHFALSSDLQ